MYNRHLDGCLEQLRFLRGDLKAIRKALYKRTEYVDEDFIEEATEELIEACHVLMGDCCNLYEEIEERFGIDVYND